MPWLMLLPWRYFHELGLIAEQNHLSLHWSDVSEAVL